MYEEESGDVTTALQSSSLEVFNQSMIDRILELTTNTTDSFVSISQLTFDGTGDSSVPAGTDIVMIQTDADSVTTLTNISAPVVIFQGGGVIATINGGTGQDTVEAGTVQRVVVGSAGNDNIVIADNQNTQVTTGAGDTVTGGAGADTVIAGFGDSTVVGGTGYTVVQLGGTDADYAVTVDGDGNAIVTGLGNSTTLTNITFVQLAGGDALILARNANEAAVATMYEATFGRAADGNGLDFWFDRVNEGVSLEAIADGFIASAEYAALAPVSDSAFVTSVYSHTGVTATDAEVSAWLTMLTDGTADRGDVVYDVTGVVASDLADNTGVEFIGSVTIIQNII